MGFEAPLQLFWAATLIVVVLLYARWARRNVYATAALPIWEQALARRTLWSRLRRGVSLAAACVPIVLIALALTRPHLWPAVNSARTLIAVVDATASMNAESAGQSRLAQAKQKAREIVGNLRTHESMAIISADSAVRVRCGLTSDKTMLYAAIDSIQPTDGASGVPGAIAAAQAVAAGQRNGMVVLLSDGAFTGAKEIGQRGGSEKDNVVWIPFGETAENVAITRFAARPRGDGGPTYDVLVELANFGPTPLSAALKMLLDARTVIQMEVNIPAGAKAQRVLPIDVPQAGMLTARLMRDDALPADNSASLLLAAPRPARVLLIGGEKGSPLEAALRNIRGIRWEVGDSISSPRNDTAGETILVFDGDAPREVPAHPALVIAPAESSDLWRHDGTAASPGAVSKQPHPLWDDVDLTGVIVDRAMKLTFSGDAEIIAAAADGSPMCAVVPREEGDVVVLAFSPEGSDFGWRGEFPRWTASAIAWLGRRHASPPRQWITSSVLELPEANSLRRLSTPYGQVSEADAQGSIVISLAQAGQWQWQDEAGRVEAVLPVNLLNESESDLRPREVNLGKAWPQSTIWPDVGPLSSIFIALALVWVIGHWVLYQRGDVD